MYFIYKRTFRYGDMSLIYLFTNIFIHFCPGLKESTWFLYRMYSIYMKLSSAITDVSTWLHSNYMQINYFEIKNVWCHIVSGLERTCCICTSIHHHFSQVRTRTDSRCNAAKVKKVLWQVSIWHIYVIIFHTAVWEHTLLLEPYR